MNKEKTILFITENKNGWLLERSGWGMGRRGEWDSEVKTSSYKISHRDKKYSIGNMVSNIVILLCGDRGDYTYCGEH